MNEARFFELLAAYGAELSRWPVEERAKAEALLASAPHRIKDIWESERAFDHLLGLERDSPAPIGLESRILAEAPRAGQAVRRRWLPAWRLPQWATGGAIAASLALGFAVGYAGEPEPAGANADYAKMLTLTGGGAGSMFLAAIDDVES